MKPLEFEPQKALQALDRFGFHHLDVSTPRSLLEPFMEEHGLELEEGALMTITLVPKGRKSGGQDWEALRQANQKKRVKAAEAKKRKEQAE